MIEARKLTKRYGSLNAVNALSFNVGPGEVLGFLGPNGAGKTTTMRMLTGFLPAGWTLERGERKLVLGIFASPELGFFRIIPKGFIG